MSFSWHSPASLNRSFQHRAGESKCLASYQNLPGKLLLSRFLGVATADTLLFLIYKVWQGKSLHASTAAVIPFTKSIRVPLALLSLLQGRVPGKTAPNHHLGKRSSFHRSLCCPSRALWCSLGSFRGCSFVLPGAAALTLSAEG